MEVSIICKLLKLQMVKTCGAQFLIVSAPQVEIHFLVRAKEIIKDLAFWRNFLKTLSQTKLFH